MGNVKPKKHLGQHFLTDKNIVRKMVALVPQSDSTVYEIGPGTGILTEGLIERGFPVTAFEIDPESVQYLEERFKNAALTIISGDFLEFTLDKLSLNAYWAGNLPYNITSPIFFKLVENRAYISEGVFMIQKEVADRLAAPHGSKTYGLLSVYLQAFFEVKVEFKVPPGVFNPPPKVMSAVISLKRKSERNINTARLLRLVKAAFGQRRKILGNALKSGGIQLPDSHQHLLTLRAESIPVETYIELEPLFIST